MCIQNIFKFLYILILNLKKKKVCFFNLIEENENYVVVLVCSGDDGSYLLMFFKDFG